jgi:cellobiose PTS system EIIB component
VDNINIMLCCGAGMSSGFLAQKGRQAAKKRAINVTIEARSESEVGSYLSQIDILMIGPHYAGHLEEFSKMAEPFGVLVTVIPKKIYAELDGNSLLDFAFETLEKNKK